MLIIVHFFSKELLGKICFDPCPATGNRQVTKCCCVINHRKTTDKQPVIYILQYPKQVNWFAGILFGFRIIMT